MNKHRTIVRIDDTDQMNREWNAWQQVCGQLRALGIKVNGPDAKALCAAINLWGEELAELRAMQRDTDLPEETARRRWAYRTHTLSETQLEALAEGDKAEGVK